MFVNYTAVLGPLQMTLMDVAATIHSNTVLVAGYSPIAPLLLIPAVANVSMKQDTVCLAPIRVVPALDALQLPLHRQRVTLSPAQSRRHVHTYQWILLHRLILLVLGQRLEFWRGQRSFLGALLLPLKPTLCRIVPGLCRS